VENVDEESRGNAMEKVEKVYMLDLRVKEGQQGEAGRKEKECAPRKETETTVHNLREKNKQAHLEIPLPQVVRVLLSPKGGQYQRVLVQVHLRPTLRLDYDNSAASEGGKGREGEGRGGVATEELVNGAHLLAEEISMLLRWSRRGAHTGPHSYSS
jgi:hypothetical protein